MAWTLGEPPATLLRPRGASEGPFDRASASFLQPAWDWFDRLSNLQTAGLLSSILIILLTSTALLLLPVLSPRAPATTPVVVTAPAPVRPAATPPPALPERHIAHTVPLGVNLRAEPSVTASSLATLPTDTEVVLLGETTSTEGFLWQHVRTADGREGWIIDNALE